MTGSFGPVAVVRRQWRCAACGDVGCAADDRLGIDGTHTPRLRRLLALVAVGHGFARAARVVAELLGVRLGAETLRRAAHRQGRRAEAWLDASPLPAERMAAAEGDAELATDAVKVPTLGGWRDLKADVWCRRPAGRPAAPSEWRARRLPAPTAKYVRVAIREAKDFTADWATRPARLGLPSAAPPSVLADGADWIWNGKRAHLPDGEGVLDVYHAAERLHATGAALFGEGAAASREWAEGCVAALVEGGWPGLEPRLAAALAEHRRAKAKTTALYETRTYFFVRRAWLGYKGRLAGGRSIGSGAVEGEAKQLGKRLKVSGRGWTVGNVVRMGSLLAISHAGLWDDFWRG